MYKNGMPLDRLGAIRRAVFWKFMAKSSRPEAMSKPTARVVESPLTGSGPFDALFHDEIISAGGHEQAKGASVEMPLDKLGTIRRAVFWRFTMKLPRPEAMSKPT